MATSSLTTSGINSFVTSYKQAQYERRIQPLATRKSKFSNIGTALSQLNTKLSSMKTLLTDFKTSTSTSLFNTKKAVSSNENFLTATAGKTASLGSYDFFISQLAKNDIAVSKDMATDTLTTLSGSHSFVLKTGDGSTGEFTSAIDVEFDGTETNKEVMEAIQQAINSDKAVVTSDAKTGSSSYAGGTSTFTINLNGTETDITVDGGGTYEELIDELVSKINTDIAGLTAEKITDSPNPGDVRLQLQVENSDHYISISHKSGNDIVADLNIETTKEKAASGMVTASVFTPRSGVHQLSMSSKNTGLDYRIKELSDSGTSTALAEIGLNLGTSRPSFDQSGDPDTPGFVYSDITDANNLLNTKFTFNGLNIQKNSNSVTDLVEGLTFDFKSVMKETDNKVNISISNNNEEVKGQIESFINTFNDVYTFLKTKSMSSDGVRGVLLGEANTSSLLNTLRTIAYQPVTGLASGTINYLSQIGISFNSTSGLSISDSSLLNQKLTENISEVKDLFTSENGLATKLYSGIESYVGAEGYLTTSIDTYNSSTSYIDKRISSIQSSIDKTAEVLRNKYQNLQLQYATLLSSSSLFSSGSTSTESYY